MSENRSTWEILGSLLGLVILIVVLYAAVGYFREGTTELTEQARVAGRPVTLSESLAGAVGEEAGEEVSEEATTGGEEGVAAGEVVTATAAMTETAAITGATEVTLTAELTTTDVTTETGEVEGAAAITTTGALTEPVAITETAAVTAATAVTVTEPTTATTVVTATTTISDAGAVVTTTAIVTTTEELSPTTELTATSAVSDTAAATATEAPPEVIAAVTKGTCFACHVIPGIPTAVGQVGPNLSEIGATAATRIPGYTAEEYIHESLLNPNAFVAPECPTGPCLPNLMVQNLGDILTPEEIDAVVAYLTTLGAATQ